MLQSGHVAGHDLPANPESGAELPALAPVLKALRVETAARNRDWCQY